MSEPRCLFIAAGGTGGHIYPALAIAEAIKIKRPELKIFFVGTPSGLENKIVPPRGFSVLHIHVGKLNQVPLRERLWTIARMPFSLFESYRTLKRYRPALVLGAGGYASGPVLLMAALLRVPTAIWEPNAMPGITNRILSRFVDECMLVFESAKSYLHGRTESVGMPVRKEIEAPTSATRSDRTRVLIFGGSQGARAINNTVTEMLTGGGDFIRKHEIVHQTGPLDFSRIQELYGPTVENLELTEYLHDMHKRYAWADVVVSRAGAATLAELAACGKAAVLIPLPTASDNHQQRNAEALVKEDAALMILQKDLTPQKLRETLLSLETQPEHRHRLEQNIRRFHQPGAAEKIASHLLRRI